MLTGVIYGAIVIVWAAYLVPLALRRHDEASRTRSVERFSSAMRVLARRGATVGAATAAGARVVVTPKRGDTRVLAPDAGPEPERILVKPPRNRAAERAAAARRLRVLSALVGLTVVIGLVSVVGLLPIWSVLLPLAGVVAFLFIARRSVRRAHEPYWVEAPAPEQSSSVVVRRTAVRVNASKEVAGEADDDEPTISLTAAERTRAAAEHVEVGVASVSTRTSDGGSLWDPLPVTLPTYVDAAVATRTFRTIEIGEPGTWSSGHSAAASKTATDAASGSQHPRGEAPMDEDEITEEIPRVVNG